MRAERNSPPAPIALEMTRRNLCSLSLQSMAKYEPHDRFYRKARERGLPSRAAFKIEELLARFRLVRPGARVVDLGCAPGGWLSMLAAAVGPQGRVAGIDLAACPASAANVVTMVGDIRDPASVAAVAAALRRARRSGDQRPCAQA